MSIFFQKDITKLLVMALYFSCIIEIEGNRNLANNWYPLIGFTSQKIEFLFQEYFVFGLQELNYTFVEEKSTLESVWNMIFDQHWFVFSQEVFIIIPWYSTVVLRLLISELIEVRNAQIRSSIVLIKLLNKNVLDHYLV